MPSLHYSFISYDNINLVQEQGSTQIAMSSTEMQSYINSTFLIRTVLLQLYVIFSSIFVWTVILEETSWPVTAMFTALLFML